MLLSIRMLKAFVFSGVMLGSSACTFVNQKPVQSVIVGNPSLPVPVAPAARPTLEQKMNAQAEALFRRGSLLSPAEDNAYLRYRAVQLLFPESRQAKAGLDAILVNEVNAARGLLEQSKLTQVNKKLVTLNEYFPNALLLDSLESELKKTRRVMRVASQVASKDVVEDASYIYLDQQGVATKDKVVLLALAGIAKQIADTDESVLIYARSDSDARWIYKTMRDAVPGYRIRGDIRIGKPAVRLLPPLGG